MEQKERELSDTSNIDGEQTYARPCSCASVPTKAISEIAKESFMVEERDRCCVCNRWPSKIANVLIFGDRVGVEA